MFSHIMIGSNDMTRSKSFYDALIGSMGGKPGVQDPGGRLVYAHRGGRLMITKPIDGAPASGANGGTIGFTLESSEDVDTWHRVGAEHGGTACEDPSGLRKSASGAALYLAYLRDPDGNKLCALHRMP